MEKNKMKLSYIILYMEDVTKATEFYHKAFDLDVKFIHDSGTYAEMKGGDITFAFASNDLWKANTGLDVNNGPKNGVEIAFTTEDVPKGVAQALKNGAKEIKKPQQKPWGQTVAYVQDPFGTMIEICSPMP